MEIQENGKYGYIDSNGQVVIIEKYFKKGDYSEGLAHARLNGTYGYVDLEGNFVIAPEYDYATPFSEGLGLVFKDAKPIFIDKKGKQVLELNFLSASPFMHGIALVETVTRKQGAINKKGELIIDTVLREINRFEDGLAVVEGINYYYTENPPFDRKPVLEMGVVDTLGNFIIPFGKYSLIHTLENGYFQVQIPEERWDTINKFTAQRGFADRTGKVMFMKTKSEICYFSGPVSCGLVQTNLYKSKPVPLNDSWDNTHVGYLNLKGEVIFSDTNFTRGMPFVYNRAFVHGKDDKYVMINTKGNFVSGMRYDEVNQFTAGKTYVKKENGAWNTIDTNENIMPYVTPTPFASETNPPQEEQEIKERKKGKKKSGKEIIEKPIRQHVDETELNDRKVNIDMINKVQYCLDGYHGSSDTLPSQILGSFPENALTIKIYPEIKSTYSDFRSSYDAITIVARNMTDQPIYFASTNECLYMNIQAQDRYGQWKDIEQPQTFPSCLGNDYGLKMDPGEYWRIVSPEYGGSFKTKMRVKMRYLDPEDKSPNDYDKKILYLYSNAFDGFINPGQLWRDERPHVDYKLIPVYRNWLDRE